MCARAGVLCACVRASVRQCVSACVCVRVRACVRACACVCVWPQIGSPPSAKETSARSSRPAGRPARGSRASLVRPETPFSGYSGTKPYQRSPSRAPLVRKFTLVREIEALANCKHFCSVLGPYNNSCGARVCVRVRECACVRVRVAPNRATAVGQEIPAPKSTRRRGARQPGFVKVPPDEFRAGCATAGRPCPAGRVCVCRPCLPDVGVRIRPWWAARRFDRLV